MGDPLTVLSGVSYADLLPSSLSTDPTVQALVAAIDAELQPLLADLDHTMLLHRVALLPERVLDLLAIELDVNPYEQAYTLAQKRDLIADAISVHRTRGTGAALPPVVAAIFGGAASTQEWFAYGGPPHAFRIVLDAALADPALFDALVQVVGQVKNVRSYLDQVVIGTGESTCPVYAGATAHLWIDCPVGMAV
jgi:phage tail P2-like protein